MPQTLVIIDVQKDFISLDGLLSLFKDKKDESDAFIATINNFLEKIPEGFFDSILITQDTHFHEYYQETPEGQKYPLHCDFETEGWKLAFDINKLETHKNSIYFLNKSEFDMWNAKVFPSPTILNDKERWDAQKNLNKIKKDTYEFSMDEFYQKYMTEDRIYICGVASDVCVRCAIEGFQKRENRIFILDDLTKGIEKEIEEVLLTCYDKNLPRSSSNRVHSIVSSDDLVESFVSKKLHGHKLVGSYSKLPKS